MQQHHMTETTKHAIDVAAGTTGLGAFIGWLPDIAAFLTIIWLSFRIYDWIENRIKNRKKK